jgi:class 3 adenylate cyclase
LSRNKLKAEVAAEVMSAALKERGPKVNTRALHAIAFLDITQSTDDLAKAGDEDWRARIQAFYDAARRLIEEVGGRVVKTTGDGFLAVFPTADGGLAAMSKAHRAGATMGFVCRTGMHLAETETVDERDIAGIGVNIAARVLGKAQPGRIVVTSAIRDSTQGSRHVFRAIGQTVLRGVPGEWSIFELAGIA